MNSYERHLISIDQQRDKMVELVKTWSNINSGSDNISGLKRMLSALKSAFSPLLAKMKEVPIKERKIIDSNGHEHSLRQGVVLHLKKHAKAPLQILLAGHYDTVFSPSHSFQKAEQTKENILVGPGVADMKGGLAILLKCLENLEHSPLAGKIGWEVILNADEEVGSVGSEPLFREAAARNKIGLIFEPSFADGSLVHSRKGSANFVVVVRGKSAHAGRDFHAGRSAIAALAKFIHLAEALNDPKEGITLNFGQIEGGGAVNIVPDLAICRLNARVIDTNDLVKLKGHLRQLIDEGNKREGISLILHELSEREPKPFDQKNQNLFELLKNTAQEIGMSISWKPSGGVCDGNILSSSGLPTIDTLGAIGGEIHTSNEYIYIDSLTERCKLTTYFLMKIASGEIKL
jgi:glutamate carboxypeptidase